MELFQLTALTVIWAGIWLWSDAIKGGRRARGQFWHLCDDGTDFAIRIPPRSLPLTLQCTVNTCSLVFGSFLYLPNVPANAFFAALFALILVASTALSIRGRNWGYMAGMIGGLVMEVIGYVGRIMIHNNDFSGSPFYLYIICLTIGPAFLSASIYLCLARIVAVYGSHLSRFKPKTYTKIFVACDFLSLVLQGTGGGMASSFKSGTTGSKAGLDIMIAGLAFQVVSLSIFIGLYPS